MKTEELIKAGEDCYNLANANDWHLSGESICNVIQLYSDQQNKELRERLAQEDEKAVFIERANAEIQRLTKEVEELKASLVDERANGRIEWERLQLSEITRLRELLERAKKELMMCATSKTQQLLADIEKETRDR